MADTSLKELKCMKEHHSRHTFGYFALVSQEFAWDSYQQKWHCLKAVTKLAFFCEGRWNSLVWRMTVRIWGPSQMKRIWFCSILILCIQTPFPFSFPLVLSTVHSCQDHPSCLFRIARMSFSLNIIDPMSKISPEDHL